MDDQVRLLVAALRTDEAHCTVETAAKKSVFFEKRTSYSKERSHQFLSLANPFASQGRAGYGKEGGTALVSNRLANQSCKSDIARRRNKMA